VFVVVRSYLKEKKKKKKEERRESETYL